MLDVALNTLSEPSSRAAHDAQIAPATPVNAGLPGKLLGASGVGDGRALQLATSAAEMNMSNVVIDERRFQFEAVSKTVGSSLRSLKVILRVFLWLLVLGIVIRIGSCTLTARNSVPPLAQVAKAEEKLIIQAYYKTHGVRASSRAEVAALEAENRRIENERREDAFKREKAVDELDRTFDESRRDFQRLEQEREWERRRAEAEARREEMLRRQREQQARHGSNPGSGFASNRFNRSDN